MQVETNGTALHAVVEGVEKGPWVVLAHGIATDLHLWDGVARVLAPHYRILRYDTRGHGRSEAPPGPYDLDMLGRDAIGLMTALDIARAHFVGLSLGGMTGLGLALSHPERLLSLACCDARASAPAAYRDAWAERGAAVAAQGMEAMVEPSLSRWFARGFREAQPDLAAQVAGMVRGTAPEGYRGCAAALQGLDYGGQLGDIELPVLYLTGKEDQGAPPEVMRAMQHATPGARYVEIPHAGHLSAIEQPEAVGAALHRFFSSLAAEPAR
ncbi:alpha/beta fold hydrolase [Roseomonas sp. E05]|uniref:alpha/beta fold hydrolase n=1 Tax=Roseomonas sp. E05 TaxID=3046310 RepID=UPI0024B9585D|nr:alpha/beta fold hydrolase [Roseomonas sp. E05]MDJ0387696.1 alpha/beta fold hydrolase [Roseomonas sp. E05]